MEAVLGGARHAGGLGHGLVVGRPKPASDTDGHEVNGSLAPVKVTESTRGPEGSGVTLFKEETVERWEPW